MPPARLRLLHAIHDFLPRHRAGSEIYAFELARELAHRHDVTVLTAEYDPSRPHGHVTWRVYGGLQVVEVVNNWVCQSFGDTYRSPVVSRRADEILGILQPDVVHLHSLLNLTFDLPALARSHGARCVATLHDYTLVCPAGGQRIHRAEEHVCHHIDTVRCARCFRESPLYPQVIVARVASAIPAGGALGRAALRFRALFPRLAARAATAARQAGGVTVTERDIRDRLDAARALLDQIDLFVAPSESLASEFVSLGLDRARLRVVDYGFPPMTGARRTTVGDRLRLGFVGTLVWHKGVHVLLAAVRELPASAYELLVFGDLTVFPDYVHGLTTQAAGLPVRFLGAFDREQAADVYAQFDVLIVPSLWLENSPLVIHEAFMAGVPVVGARIGGIANLVVDGVNGFLYEPTSPTDLANVLQTLVASPTLVRDLAERVPEVTSMADHACDWERRYAEVLARGGTSHP
jgi:glycosyltransferase involved in cell wall biosynthesis